MTNYGGANGYGKAISFSSEMVKAIFDGQKTQTRRIMKPQPDDRGPRASIERRSFEDWHGKPIEMQYELCDELRIRETDLWIKITDVRVERLWDISEEDAKAEGTERMALDDLGGSCRTHKRGFQSLWESIHGEGAWEANPWVWVYDFRRIT